jgi:hypothetical protein
MRCNKCSSKQSEIFEAVHSIRIKVSSLVSFDGSQSAEIVFRPSDEQQPVVSIELAVKVQVCEDAKHLSKSPPDVAAQIVKASDVFTTDELRFKGHRELGLEFVSTKLLCSEVNKTCVVRVYRRLQLQQGLPERIGLEIGMYESKVPIFSRHG